MKFAPGDRVVLFFYTTTKPSLYGVVVRDLTDAHYEVLVTKVPAVRNKSAAARIGAEVIWKTRYMGRDLGEELLNDEQGSETVQAG